MGYYSRAVCYINIALIKRIRKSQGVTWYHTSLFISCWVRYGHCCAAAIAEWQNHIMPHNATREKADFHLSKYVGRPCAQRPSTFAQFNFWTIVGVMSFESWMKPQHATQRRSTNKQIVNYRSKSASCALSTLRFSQNSIFERLLGSCLLRANFLVGSGT